MADDWEEHGNSKESFLFLKGTCMEMCPARERTLRAKQRRLHPFETIQDSCNGRKNPKADIELTVKEFSRPAAGRYIQADELRPAPVLVKTIDYLLKDVIARPDPWFSKCEFISDRIRAIRQDLTAQDIVNSEAIDVLEKAVRYYLVAAVKLSNEPLRNFDPVLHDTQTQQCLKKLLLLYKNQSTKVYPNQASFEACYLLLNLGNPQAYHHVLHLPYYMRNSGILKSAFQLTKAYLHGNYVAIFRTLKTLPFLESCAFFRHITPVRCQALEVMSMAYSSRNASYPLPLLTKILCFQSEDSTREFCSNHGIRVTAEKVFFSKGEFVKPEKHESYPEPVMSKLEHSISDVLLFHKQTNCNENIEDTSEKTVVKDKGGFPSKIEGQCMPGKQQQELTSQKRTGRSRGRGRGQKK